MITDVHFSNGTWYEDRLCLFRACEWSILVILYYFGFHVERLNTDLGA